MVAPLPSSMEKLVHVMMGKQECSICCGSLNTSPVIAAMLMKETCMQPLANPQAATVAAMAAGLDSLIIQLFKCMLG